MRLAVMQPYFLPYIGYWQLLAAVDLFVLYDNIQYTKKGWINRNRMLLNGADAMFSLSLKSAADGLDVRERQLAESFDRAKLLRQFEGAYRRAPQFDATWPLLSKAIAANTDDNLYAFLRASIEAVRDHLGLATEIRTSSTVTIDHGLKAEAKVLALCEALGAATYVNAIGGQELYAADRFAARGMQLQFLRARPLAYPQLGAAFVPWLSIVDVLMFNPLDTVQAWVRGHYDLIA